MLLQQWTFLDFAVLWDKDIKTEEVRQAEYVLFAREVTRPDVVKPKVVLLLTGCLSAVTIYSNISVRSRF